MSSNPVRVRFAPAPTGDLHVGGARTALFNWLFARHYGGKFILRIDDTDQSRSSEESAKGIFEAFRWLKLDWDEGPSLGGDKGPYYQSERMEIYREYIHKLLKEGQAYYYYCYCTPEELEAERAKAQAEHRPPRYSGKCRNLTDEKRRRYEAEGRKPAIRMKTESGDIVIDDLILGRVEFKAENLEDFVMVRSNGIPTYNFAEPIDDFLMEITHVIRAQEHLSNTPKQIMLYRALGIQPPQFAHVPMVLGVDKQKLSKRHGATSVGEFRAEGFLPEAMANYLARLGWSADAETEIFSVDELIEKFDLSRVGKSPGIFDKAKLTWLNGEYLKNMSLSQRTEAVLPVLIKEGLIAEAEVEGKRKWLEAVVDTVGDRLKTLNNIVDYAGFLFVDKPAYDDKSLKDWIEKDYVPQMFEKLKTLISKVEPFDELSLETAIRSFVEAEGLSGIKVMQPIRVALTGKSVGPDLFKSLVLLGKEKVLRRFDQALEGIRRLHTL